MNKKFLLLPTFVLLLASCASVTSGTTQTISIVTPDAEEAKCELADSKSGRWYLPQSPGSVTVKKGDGPMTITCRKEKYKTAVVQVDEELAGATLGNIILGGGIGIFVDAASGAAQKYPDQVYVWMEPNKWSSAEKKQDWMDRKSAYEREQEEKRRREQEEAQASQNRSYVK